MTIVVGIIVTLVCMLGGFMAMGGKVGVIWQPWEYVIICGSAFGTFIVANPLKSRLPSTRWINLNNPASNLSPEAKKW